MSYNSSSFRRGRTPTEPVPDKMSIQVKQLQELFSTWSEDDLMSLLQETNSDLELAIARITEGHAEQWGSVTRKKEKRTSNNNTPAPRESTTGRERGDSRGGRGARGGRGGGRGAGRGLSRGGRRDTNGYHSGSPATGNGVASKHEEIQPMTADDPSGKSGWDVGDGTTAVATEAASSGWVDAPAFQAEAAAPSSGAGWGASSGWDQTSVPSASSIQAPLPVKPTKPATSKMSWAQIARPQEKPTPVPVISPPVTQPSAPPPASVPEFEEELQEPSREDFTTVQSPTWDDEAQVQVPTSLPADGWGVPEEPSAIPSLHEELSPAPAPAPEVQLTPSALPAQLQSNQKSETAQPLSPAKPTTPISVARPTSAAHRNNARFKTSDQPVVMPTSSFGTVMDKIGMQFGSVSLGGDEAVDVSPDTPEAPVEQTIGRPTERSLPSTANVSPALPKQSQAPPSFQSQEPPVAPSAAPVSHAPLSTSSLFQQSVPQQPQQQQFQHPSQQVSPAVTHTSQPLTPSQSSALPQTSSSISSPLPPFTHQTTPSQHSMSPSYHQQGQQAPLPPQTQLHQQYSLHGFQGHLDSPLGQQSLPNAHPSATHQGNASHGSYFRQHDQAYFHSPTPPTQAQESPYAPFSPLGHQLPHQGQNSHLSGFGGDQYGYTDSSRGFYDSYGQPTAFGNRNMLGHEDVPKSLPSVQQPPAAAGLNPTASQQPQQSSQQQQSTGQPQTAGAQAQQGYPPVQYYYTPYTQPNQFYPPGGYGSGYSLNQYSRYQPAQPPMFSPAASGPTSTTVSKGPSTVQQQSNPYAPGLYGQQHSSPGYDDAGYTHSQLQHNQGVGNLPSNDYGKPLYSTHGGQSMQGFMGMGQSTSATSGTTLGQRAGVTGSPENTYKSYGGSVGVGKDVGAGVGSTQSNVSQVPQGRTGGQQPHNVQAGFYAANRFSANPTSAGGPPGHQTQQQTQAHQGYPQGQNDSGFYYAPGRNQTGQYWQ